MKASNIVRKANLRKFDIVECCITNMSGPVLKMCAIGCCITAGACAAGYMGYGTALFVTVIRKYNELND